MKKICKIIVFFCMIVMLQSLIWEEVLAVANYKLDGWEFIEGQKNTQLWQKKDQDFSSENITNISVPLGGVVLRGYMLRGEKISEYSPVSKQPSLEIWELFYTGFDKSGNIYFKLFIEEEEIPEGNQKEIVRGIKELFELDRDHIYNRTIFFINNLKDYLKDEGEVLIIDPDKTVILKGINYIPGFNIEPLPGNSMINISVTKIEF